MLGGPGLGDAVEELEERARLAQGEALRHDLRAAASAINFLECQVSKMVDSAACPRHTAAAAASTLRSEFSESSLRKKRKGMRLSKIQTWQ